MSRELVLKKFKSLLVAKILFFSILGCGKKILDSPSESEKQTIKRSPVLSNSIELKLSFSLAESSLSSKKYIAEKSGWVIIPKKIKIKQAPSPSETSSRIYFNTSEESPSSLFCEYKVQEPLGASGELLFQECFEDIDEDGIPESINYLPGDVVAQDKTRFIILEASNSQTKGFVEISSIIEIDWH